MKNILCVIQGFFWAGSPNLAMYSPFVGEISMAEDGIFAGFTEDSYGRATIEGKLDGIVLEFDKTYDEKSRGAKGGLQFFLKTQGFQTQGKIACGGWKGENPPTAKSWARIF